MILTKSGRLTEAEGRISEVEDSATTHSAPLAELWAQVNTIAYKMDYAENRQRRNDIKSGGSPGKG